MNARRARCGWLGPGPGVDYRSQIAGRVNPIFRHIAAASISCKTSIRMSSQARSVASSGDTRSSLRRRFIVSAPFALNLRATQLYHSLKASSIGAEYPVIQLCAIALIDLTILGGDEQQSKEDVRT